MTGSTPEEKGGESQDAMGRWAESSGFHLKRTPSGEVLWDASDEQPEEKPVAVKADPVPDDRLRGWVLIWIGSGVIVTLMVTTVGLATDWFSEEFARLLQQVIVTPLLSAFMVAVGYLFAERKRR